MVITKIKVVFLTMTKTKETKTKIANKKVLLPAVIGAIVASAILTGIFITYPAISSVYAVQSFNTTTTAGTDSGGSQIPKITGSINVVQTTKNVIKDNLKVSLSQAADIAEKQITNGTIVGGHLGVVQGYLVYTFFGVNPEIHTAYHTIIDAGNGKVLYTSPAQQIGGGGFFGMLGALGGGFGSLGGLHGLAGGIGHGPFGFGFGPWRALQGFMGGDGIWH
jgi:Peptidase propeptide and YPEB domain